MSLPPSAVRFEPEDVALFAEASHDHNPLHLSAGYCRRTPYGEPVVFGILAALACLARLDPPAGRRLCTLQVEFNRPVFLGVDYHLEIRSTNEEKSIAVLLDGSIPVLRLAAGWAAGSWAGSRWIATGGAYRAEPARLGQLELQRRPVFEGDYAPLTAFEALQARLGLAPCCFPCGVLLCSTYLVGMLAPGERALYSKLRLQFDGGHAPPAGPLHYRYAVESYDERYQLVEGVLQIAAGPDLRAEGSLWGILRPESEDAVPLPLLPPSEQLAGRVALIAGASRGLGAALAMAFASQGCSVWVSYLRGREAAEKLVKAGATLPGSIRALQGDASDPEFLGSLRTDLERGPARLDYLVCNACSAVLPQRLEATSLARVNDFVARNFALVSAPLAYFLPMLAGSEGTCTVVSSIYVDPAAADYPHYVALKSAVEGLARSAAGQNPKVRFLLARPPVLATDLTNTPNRPAGALAPAEYARRLMIRYLAADLPSGASILS